MAAAVLGRVDVLVIGAGNAAANAALQAREIRTLMKPVELDRLCTVALDMLSRP